MDFAGCLVGRVNDWHSLSERAALGSCDTQRAHLRMVGAFPVIELDVSRSGVLRVGESGEAAVIANLMAGRDRNS